MRKLLAFFMVVTSSAVIGRAAATPRDLSRGQIFNLEILHEAMRSEGSEFSLPLPFSFPDDARRNSVFGVDVSHHVFDQCHCVADWKRAATERVAFAYLKATQGDRFQDHTFVANWRSLRPTNIYRGAYHFLQSDVDALKQAKHFVKVIREAGGLTARDLPPSLDIEWDIRLNADGTIIRRADGRPFDFWSKVPADEIVRKMEVWLVYVQSALNRTPVIYTSHAWWVGRFNDDHLMKHFSKYKTWIADYSRSGLASESPHDFIDHARSLWQFTDVGKIAHGRSNPKGDLSTDVSIFSGGMDDFKRSFGVR